MALPKTYAAALCAVLLAGGCSFSEDALFPSVGVNGNGQASGTPQVQAEPPMMGSSSFEAAGVTPGQPTGTFVGQKVQSLRGDLQQLQTSLTRQNQQLQSIRNDTARDSQAYHGTVAAINSRLQVGTTPGNPVLMQQWNGAQAELDRINEDVLKMNRLANEVASASAMSSYVLDSVRAARGLSGAVDEDHRQLRILEDETNRTVVQIDRLLTELSSDISRQQQYVANEKSNLNTLALAIKNGQLYGPSLENRINQAAAQAVYQPTSAPAPQINSAADRPLVVIRFDRPGVEYESALYTAVKGALDRRPNAAFDIVAVSPTNGSSSQAAIGSTNARRNAEAVVRSLTNMGLPASRLRLSASTSSTASSGEVHVFVR